MRGIGHYDFGANLKPINFDHWMENRSVAEATDLNFWLQYWVAAYGSIQNQLEPRIRLFSFDHFCEAPDHSLQMLGEYLQLNHTDQLTAQAKRIHSPKAHSTATDTLDPALVAQAEDLYTQLTDKALNT